jgi:N-methylhydantoinase A/oxoprolinase/acetone carboxylase beta subunit
MYRLAFDIGGTFTDFALQDVRTGAMTFSKALSTPDRPARAVLTGLQQLLADARVTPEEVGHVAHATTIAANAIIERKGRATGLITTEGFRDVLIIGREKRYETYDLFLDKPAPLTKRRLLVEVRERLAHDGEVLRPLDMGSVHAALDALLAQGVESVAVSLLHSYVNPDHERLIRECIQSRAPGLSVSLSTDVSPKYREYERASTTVANAYVKPIVAAYVAELQDELRHRGFNRSFFIMQSNGGLAAPEVVREYPVRIIESGPAAGVLMCAGIGSQEGYSDVLTFDMGGTTAKLGAIDGGEPAITPTFEVDAVRYRKGSGLPLNISAIELLEIGAGGGSVAGVDLGMIVVGPESAGADPGPICYGRGGRRVTVTDANLVLGYLNPGYFNGGAMGLDPALAREGIREQLAEPLGLSVGEAAWGVHTVANANMERALRIMSVERGRDPRQYALVAFGGAGPLHAARLARAVGIKQVIVPQGAGVGSAVGLLSADNKFDVSVTRLTSLTPDSSHLVATIYRHLEEQAMSTLEQRGHGGRLSWKRFAYMRYAGQGYELRVDVPEGDIGERYADLLIPAFHAAYERTYGYSQPNAPIEAVDWHLVAIEPTPGVRSTTPETPPRPPQGADGPVGAWRDAYFPELGGYARTQVVNRYEMAPGQQTPGPAVIEERESTTVVQPGDVARVSALGHLTVTIGEEA